jgi:hypothetical protein
MATPGSIIEQGGNLYRVDQETYTYYDTVVSTQTTTDFTGFDDVPICRPKIIYFKVVGLRPNTRHFVYFDKVDVSNYINTSISNVEEYRTLPRNDPKRNPGDRYITANGFPSELGGPTTPILSNASGTIEGVFYLQSNDIVNFPTGKRTMSFIDINVLDPSRALSFASTTFTVDGGIENYVTNYYTSSQQVARTGTRNNLTFVAPVITEAVVNNITNTYVTEVTNEYVTNVVEENTYVTEEYINNEYVTNVTEEITYVVNETTIIQTGGVDQEGGSTGETIVDTGSGSTTGNDLNGGINTNANDNSSQEQDPHLTHTVAEYWGHDDDDDNWNSTYTLDDDMCYGDISQNPAGGWGLPGDDDDGGSGGNDSKVVCTAMNNAYGFGSFRQKIWLQQSTGLAKEYQIGYHAIALPLIKYAYHTNNIGHKGVRNFLEHCARHRTADIWKQKRGKRDWIGAVERTIIEPICFITGWTILKLKNRK